jgi:hypothetical protein
VARGEEYGELEEQAGALEQKVTTLQDAEPEGREPLLDALEKLRRRYTEIERIDYFDCPEGSRLAGQLARIAQVLSPNTTGTSQVSPALLAEYRGRTWATRPRPHVDRLACAWLIRRFIDPSAEIRYSLEPTAGEVAFDMPNAQFGHLGPLCTFEVMIRAFGLEDPGLQAVAEVVHDIDLRDARYRRPETMGIDAVLEGWQAGNAPDDEREAQGIALFEGLYTAFSQLPPARAAQEAGG